MKNILKLVFETLKMNELYINLKKCTFNIGRISFLRLIICENQIKMDEAKVEVVITWPIPNSKESLSLYGIGVSPRLE